MPRGIPNSTWYHCGIWIVFKDYCPKCGTKKEDC